MSKTSRYEEVNELFQDLRENYGPELGEKIIDAIIQKLGGLRVSFPDYGNFYQDERDKKIRASFNGSNVNDLVIRWNLSGRQIRRIVGRR